MSSYVCNADSVALYDAAEIIKICYVYLNTMISNMNGSITLTNNVATEDNNYIVNIGLTGNDEDNKVLKDVMYALSKAIKKYYSEMKIDF